MEQDERDSFQITVDHTICEQVFKQKGTLLTVRRVYRLKARQKHKNNKTNTWANTLGIPPHPLQPPQAFWNWSRKKISCIYILCTYQASVLSNDKYLLLSDLAPGVILWRIVWGTDSTIHHIHGEDVTTDCTHSTYTSILGLIHVVCCTRYLVRNQMHIKCTWWQPYSTLQILMQHTRRYAHHILILEASVWCVHRCRDSKVVQPCKSMYP